MRHIDISVVIPLYNESEVFEFLIERLNKLKSNLLNKEVEFVLIDDGSSDDTPLLMSKLAFQDHFYQCIFLSRNFGHSKAISAGLMYAKGKEAIFIMDGDLQDPPELLTDFYLKLKEGYDVVYAIRKERKESKFKVALYYIFYRLLSRISEIDLPHDSGDFSLISRRVLNIINKMPEQDRYLRGMRTWVGFKQCGIEYIRDHRHSGNTKYSFKELINLAYNGIFNFSIIPIKILTFLGFTAIVVSCTFFTYSVILRLKTEAVPSGYTSLLFFMVLFGGIQLISLGIIGEYVVRIFNQVKKRPLFVIKEHIDNKIIVNK